MLHGHLLVLNAVYMTDTSAFVVNDVKFGYLD